MRLTIARLRLGIIVLTCLLLVVLAGFFLYARYRIHRFAKDLPAKLGIDIQQTANGFTYSQSSKGHTFFTIHASKLIQYKTGGHATLHDVQITLYGPEGSSRTDRIYGSDFDYNPEAGIASAKGEVQIDLAGLVSGQPVPGQTGKPNVTPPSPDKETGQNTVHVKTSGLVFNTKTGDAITAEHMEFATPRAAGSSIGASYNSKTGLLVLDRQVEISTSTDGNPTVVHAAHAELLRDSRQASLLSPTFDYQTEKGSADQAIVYFRKDGSVEHVDAQGHIHVTNDSGAVVTAGNSHVQLDAKSQPVQIDMGGGINFVSNDEKHSMHGNAVEGTLNFGPASTLKHAQMRNAVSFVDQVLTLDNDPKGTASREVQASKLDIDFAPGPDPKKSLAQKALATGNAAINLHTIPSKGPQQLTNITGDQLLATLQDGKTLKQLDGFGNTKIVDLAADGSTNTSKGDSLQIAFAPRPPQPAQKSGQAVSTQAKVPTAPQPAKPAPAAGSQNIQVETAIQDGNVVLTQTPAKKPGATTEPATLTAWAKHSEYHASDQILHLTGDPRLNDAQSLQLAANVLDYHRDSGDADAQGAVKATYTQPKDQKGTLPASNSGPTLGSDGPVHITAARAQLHHATNVSIFYGSPGTPARMWQADNSVIAPVLELTRNPQTLKAYGDEGSTAPVVNANLTSAIGAKHQRSVVRVHSQTLVYSDAERRGDFHGSVTAEDPDGVIRAEEVQVYLTPSAKPAPESPPAQPAQTQLDRIVATGRVTITQPGRHGTGEKLVYTADNGKYILTGAPGTPPRITDQAKGTTTGATLIFNSQDDSVVVSGGQSSAVTDTRVPK